MTEPTKADAIKVVAEQGGPDSAALLAACFEHNEREAAWVNEQVHKGLKRERDGWRSRALTAEAHLDQIHRRVFDLLRFDPDEVEAVE